VVTANIKMIAARARNPHRKFFGEIIRVFHFDILVASPSFLFPPSASENITKGKPSAARPWSVCSIEGAVASAKPWGEFENCCRAGENLRVT